MSDPVHCEARSSGCWNCSETALRRSPTSATFHRRFDAVVQVLPGGIEKVAELHARPEWGTVVQAAMDALGALGEDAN